MHYFLSHSHLCLRSIFILLVAQSSSFLTTVDGDDDDDDDDHGDGDGDGSGDEEEDNNDDSGDGDDAMARPGRRSW